MSLFPDDKDAHLEQVPRDVVKESMFDAKPHYTMSSQPVHQPKRTQCIGSKNDSPSEQDHHSSIRNIFRLPPLELTADQFTTFMVTGPLFVSKSERAVYLAACKHRIQILR